jgi:hypothetical protein
VVEGDFFQAVPEADAYLLKLILHDWNDERATAILATCARSLRPGGRITVIDTVVPDDSTFPMPAMLDLHMRTILGGRERTTAEHEESGPPPDYAWNRSPTPRPPRRSSKEPWPKRNRAARR